MTIKDFVKSLETLSNKELESKEEKIKIIFGGNKNEKIYKTTKNSL